VLYNKVWEHPQDRPAWGSVRTSSLVCARGVGSRGHREGRWRVFPLHSWRYGDRPLPGDSGLDVRSGLVLPMPC